MNLSPAELTVDADFIAGQHFASEEIVDQICDASSDAANVHHFMLGAAALALHGALVATQDAEFVQRFMDGLSLGVIERITNGEAPRAIN